VVGKENEVKVCGLFQNSGACLTERAELPFLVIFNHFSTYLLLSFGTFATTEVTTYRTMVSFALVALDPERHGMTLT